jgi:hypothetical protein
MTDLEQFRADGHAAIDWAARCPGASAGAIDLPAAAA